MTDNQELTEKLMELPRCNGRDGDFRLAVAAKIESLQEQLTTTQQALDKAVEALKLARDLKDNIHKHKEGSVRQWAIQVGKMAETALASINTNEANKTAIVENNLI